MGAIPATGKRPWFTWSSPVQAAAGVAGVVVAVALAWMWPVVVATLAAWAPAPVQTGVGYLTGAAETSAALGRVAELTWVAVVAPLARGLLLVTVVLCGAAALCVAALNRVALGGASRS